MADRYGREFEQMQKESKKYQRWVYNLADLKGEAPKLFGIPTGTKLDEMFYYVEYDEKTNKFKKKALGGLPYQAIINLVGVPETGKSVLAEQFAVYQAAHGYKVLFVTSEQPARFLYTTFKQKAIALGFDFDKIENNVVVLDASQEPELRENTISLIKTMEYAIKKKGTSIVVIDSITGFYEHKEVMARQIVRIIYNFLKKMHQTGLLVSQKRSSQGSETAEAAGGLAVPHIVDGTIVLDKKLISSKWDMQLYKMPLGSVIRTIRIDGCRLTGHDKDTYVFEINDLGLIEIKQKLSEFISKR